MSTEHPHSAPPHLRAPRCVVRMATAADAHAVLGYWRANGQRYAPPLPHAMLTLEVWARQAEAAAAELQQGTSCKPYVFSVDEHRVLGTVAITGIDESATPRSGRLGYAIAGDCEGQGLMREAVAVTLAYAFDTLGLDVVEAHYEAANVRSERLLRRLGFADPRPAPAPSGTAAWRRTELTSAEFSA